MVPIVPSPANSPEGIHLVDPGADGIVPVLLNQGPILRNRPETSNGVVGERGGAIIRESMVELIQ